MTPRTGIIPMDDLKTARHALRSLSSNLTRRDCPACGTNHRSSHLEVASIPSAESMSLSERKRYWDAVFEEKSLSSNNKERIFFSYYRCNECRLLFCRDFFSADDLQNMYNGSPDNTAGLPIEILRKTQQGYFDVLKKHSPIKGNYLEIGADIGLFTEICVNHGNFDHFWLFEPNKSVWQILQEKVQGMAHSLYPSMFDLSPIPDGTLSTGVIIHVLDHLLNPREILTEIRKKLTRSGILLIVTHDESSLLSKILGEKWPPYNIIHPQLFSPRSMEALLTSAGYKTIRVRKSYNYFPLNHLIGHAATLLGLGKGKPPVMPSVSIRIKLGNIITIASPQ